MGKGIAGLEQSYEILFTAVLIFLALLAVLCLLRAIIGPRIADRIVAVNMLGTMVIVMIAVLTVMLREDYLADICVIYAMISFLAVIVLTKVYMGVYLERKVKGSHELAEKDGEEKKEEEKEKNWTILSRGEGIWSKEEIDHAEKADHTEKTDRTEKADHTEKKGEDGE